MENIVIKEIVKKYPENYFDENLKNLIYYSEKLIYSIMNGDFEHDTYESDNILLNIKHFINEIDA